MVTFLGLVGEGAADSTGGPTDVVTVLVLVPALDVILALARFLILVSSLDIGGVPLGLGIMEGTRTGGGVSPPSPRLYPGGA